MVTDSTLPSWLYARPTYCAKSLRHSHPIIVRKVPTTTCKNKTWTESYRYPSGTFKCRVHVTVERSRIRDSYQRVIERRRPGGRVARGIRVSPNGAQCCALCCAGPFLWRIGKNRLGAKTSVAHGAATILIQEAWVLLRDGTNCLHYLPIYRSPLQSISEKVRWKC